MALLSLLFFSLFFSNLSFAAQGEDTMVVTADSHASSAALSILQHGGNAVDAAIAAQWVLNVVEPQSSGIGGGGFFLYYEADTRRIYAFDGRETAPAEAHPDMFLDENGNPYPFKPDRITGGLPVGVPGTLKLLYEVHGKFGSKSFSFADLFDPAIELAQKGFPVSKRLTYFIDQEKNRLKMFPDSKRIFLTKEGNAPRPGTILTQPQLAETFRTIKREGINVFYEGEIAQAIVDAVRKAPYHPGLMKKDDLFYYNIKERQPVQGSYRGYDIFSMGPPSSGGTTLIEALHILEGYHLRVHGLSADGMHLLSEVQKLAFQDRDHYLGDPDYVKIPYDQLLSKEYARNRAEEIDFNRAIPTIQAAVRPLHLEGTHTSHISIVDNRGNMVAFTTTIEDIFGSAMVVPGRGFFLNNELTDFDAVARNEKDEFVANAPESEKRPRSSMTPTFIFHDGKPFLILGSPGGSTIIGAVFNVLINVIDFEMSLEDAMAAPRMINRTGPIELEPEFYENAALRRDLERRGHPVLRREIIGNVQAIHFDQRDQVIIGESDPRGDGKALGY